MLDLKIKGRKAIVTGSTAGIGRATAEGLARAGASVVINGRGEARIDEAVRQAQEFKRMYDKPAYNIGLTFMEIFPVGLVITLISAGILRKKAGNRQTAGANG